MRIDPLHHLAVEFKHEAQDAVRGRMLGRTALYGS
jgi:hypothetical protein